MIKETTKAYIAGFLDGEGHFGIKKRNWKNKKGVRYMIEATQKVEHMKVLRLIKKTYGGHINITEKPNLYKLAIYKREWLVNLINDILPYLIVKKNPALKMIHYFNTDGDEGIEVEKSQIDTKSQGFSKNEM